MEKMPESCFPDRTKPGEDGTHADTRRPRRRLPAPHACPTCLPPLYLFGQHNGTPAGVTLSVTHSPLCHWPPNWPRAASQQMLVCMLT